MALSDRQIKATAAGERPTKLADGQGLFLLINPNNSRYWRLKYRIAGKEKLLSLGVYPETTLAEARSRRDAARKLISAGIDPSQERKDRKAAVIQAAEGSFEIVARDWHQRSSGKWSEDHAARILQRLEADVFPHIGTRSVTELKTRDLLVPLRKVEERGALDLASRLRQHIDGIMRYAVQTDLIETNPARDMTGALAVRKTVHRPALPLERIPELLQRIKVDQGRPLTKLALRFALLTFVRSSEFRFMRWDEIDLERATWVIPAGRQVIEGVKHSHRGAKMREPHVVPLSRQALAVLEELSVLTGRFDLVFAGDHETFKPMSENTVNSALRRMGYDTKVDVCGHGFRAMACSALLESGMWSEDAIERQMSHKERNGVRAAYTHKAEFLSQRRLMVQWWADWLDANRLMFVSPHDLAEAGKV